MFKYLAITVFSPDFSSAFQCKYNNGWIPLVEQVLQFLKDTHKLTISNCYIRSFSLGSGHNSKILCDQESSGK